MTKIEDKLLKNGVRRERREKALAVLRAGLEAADPAAAVTRHLSLEESILKVDGKTYDLAKFQRVLVVGAGKGSGVMAQAAEGILGEYLSEGRVVVKYGYSAPTQKIEVREAGHPLPDQAGVEATQWILDLIQRAGEHDLILLLISGGGSALLVSPAPSITLDDKIRLTQALLRCGARINEINAVRKHTSQVKGGQLAQVAYPATLISLILSDVVGDRLEVISSGPTVSDPTTYADAWRVLEKYRIFPQIPASIIKHLRKGKGGKIPETPKQGDPVLAKVHNVLVGNNLQAAEAAFSKAKSLGFNALVLSTSQEGEAREVGKFLAELADKILAQGQPFSPPACIIIGGETTVTVRGSGVGGRNQEMALSAALAIQGLDRVLTLASSTDGTDGPTDAAGAIAEGDTVARAMKLGLDPQQYLANNDSHSFFKALGDLIITGPTKTNVNDLALVFVF